MSVDPVVSVPLQPAMHLSIHSHIFVQVHRLQDEIVITRQTGNCKPNMAATMKSISVNRTTLIVQRTHLHSLVVVNSIGKVNSDADGD